MTFYRPSLGPRGENWQDNRVNGYIVQDPTQPWWSPWRWNPDWGQARSAPAEPPFVDYHPYIGWNQAGVKIPGFKSRKYWARPVDGKRKGTMGRFKDALTNEGADVYVVMNGDKRTLARDMPHRTQWSGWNGPDWDPNWGHPDRDRTWGEGEHFDADWVKDRECKYNFQTRKYEDKEKRMKHHMQGRLWTDAHWQDGASRDDMNPLALRTGPRMYSTRVPAWAGWFPGGRPIV